ncbi:MAG: DNA translocase FtsK [Candidatus Omnitrophota bacterium]
MKRQYIDEIKAIVIFACAVILFASLISFAPEDLPWHTSQPNLKAKNLISVFGAYMAGSLFFVWGYAGYFVVVFLLLWGWEKLNSRDIKFSLSKGISLLVLFCVLSALLSMMGSLSETARFQRAGLAGLVIADFLIKYFGRIGSWIILITLGVLAMILTGEFLVSPLLFRLSLNFRNFLTDLKEARQKKRERTLKPQPSALTQAKISSLLSEKIKKMTQPAKAQIPLEKQEKKPLLEKTVKPKDGPFPAIRVIEKEKEVPSIKEPPPVVGDYHLPDLDLLSDPPSVSSRKIQGDLMDGAKVLESTLSDFGVNARVADIERGPVITRYELEPAPGVKVQRITTLSDDIALAMRAQTVRIVAPIPGKNRVGIEVPNISSSLVFLKDVLSENVFRSATSKLTLALGKDIAGKIMIANLADMPHLLIAGTTGSGKTVCLNSLIMSMLFKAPPDEVKFLMVDPKLVELSIYNELPHALIPAVTDAKKVSAALNGVVAEMEERYRLLAQRGVRNIREYNKSVGRMHYIVVIVDELADLMQVASKQIEHAITRLAQLSRAVGIHLILATQRPSVDVITGVIKANFPARISFKVASKVDSRTVLDMNGAEALLGKGDMLFIKPGEAKPTRGQCTLVSDEEIRKVIQFIQNQQSPVYDESILKKQTTGASGGADDKDELYEEAVRTVVETGQASVSTLQFRLNVGWMRARRLIEAMEQDGIIGPYCGSKSREILVNREEWLMREMNEET